MAFGVVGDPDWLRAEAQRIKNHLHIVEVASLAEAGERFHEGLPVLPLRLNAKVRPGIPDAKNAEMVIGSIDRAVQLARSGEASAAVSLSSSTRISADRWRSRRWPMRASLTTT